MLYFKFKKPNDEKRISLYLSDLYQTRGKNLNALLITKGSNRKSVEIKTSHYLFVENKWMLFGD